MLGWRSSGFSPLPSGGAFATVPNGETAKTSSAGEEGAEAQQHRRRVGRHVAQAPAHEEEHEARPQRQQPHPQQQRALLRGPRRGGAVEGRRRGRGVRGHHVEVEVRAQEGDLEDREGRARQQRQPVDRAPPGVDPVAPPGARPVQRGADAVGARREGEDQAGLADGGHERQLCDGRLVGELRRALRHQRVLLAHEQRRRACAR